MKGHDGRTLPGRAIVLVVVVVVTLVAGAFAWSMRSGDAGERGRQDVLVDAAGPSVCRMEQLVASGSLAEASNVFWDDVHTGAHVLAARLDELGERTAEAEFLQAKGALETAFPTLAPSLSSLVPRFADAYRRALRTVGRPATADC